MLNDFDKLNRIFGVQGGEPPAQQPQPEAQERGAASPGMQAEAQSAPDAEMRGTESQALSGAENAEKEAVEVSGTITSGESESEAEAQTAEPAPTAGISDAERSGLNLLRKLDSMIYDPEKHEQRAIERKRRREERRRAEELPKRITPADVLPLMGENMRPFRLAQGRRQIDLGAYNAQNKGCFNGIRQIDALPQRKRPAQAPPQPE